MNVSFEIDKARSLAIVRITGQATADEVGAEYGRLLEDPNFEFSMNALWDISGLNLTRIPLSEVRALSGILRQLRDRRGANYNAAIVTNRSADYQLIRMYSALLRLIGSFRMRVFDNNQAATTWLDGLSRK